MYRKSDLQLVTPPCEQYKSEGYCSADPEHVHNKVTDVRGDYEERGLNTVFLPHSCNEWVIGGADEVRAMIEDLQAVLAYIEGATATEDFTLLRTHDTEKRLSRE